MTKELETLNDYVDGYLLMVYDEPEGNVRAGKAEFLEKFRTTLAGVPSTKEGEDLIKTLNRNLLKASATSSDISLNRKKGFEEALATIQSKIKELFQIENLETGTIKHFLQDIPRIPLGPKSELPTGEQLFADGAKNAEKTIREAADRISKELDKQNEVLKRHLDNNGKVIILSDEGYSDMTELEPKALQALVDGSAKSKEHLEKMVTTAVMMINKLIEMRKRDEGNDQEDSGDDF